MSEQNGTRSALAGALGLIPDDGYSERGLILGVPGLYPTVKLEWRPMLIEHRQLYSSAGERLKGFQLRKLEAEMIGQRLVNWDLKDSRGQVVPFTTANLLRLKAHLFDRIFAIVAGEKAADPDPDAAHEADLDEEARILVEAVKSGRPLLAVKEEMQQKN